MIHPTHVASESQAILDGLPEKVRRHLPKCLTKMQKECLPIAFATDENYVLSAPTGSGKSWVLTFSILRNFFQDEARKSIYIAPTRALCAQQAVWLNEALSPFNCRAAVVTGDSNSMIGDAETMQCHVFVCTPEKVDSMTRRWTDFRDIYGSITLLLLDEAHILSEERRGAVLECVVSRLERIKQNIAQVYPHLLRKLDNNTLIRTCAVSATVPNVLAIAKWLHAPVPSGVLSFGEDFRPVELEVVVEGYPQHTNDFLFSRQLDSHVDDVLQTYSKGRPTLLFCSSRKGAKDACERLQTTHVVDIGQPSQARANLEAKRKEAARSISDATLRKCASLGLAWHHAQVSAADRKIVENMFQDRLISVLACTTTLALGMNLPASLVVVKGTKAYRGAGIGMADIDKSSLIQMAGRAGRPGYDTKGTAVIMTSERDVLKYEGLLQGMEAVSSVLQGSLLEILNTEIFLGFIENIEDAMNWIKTTFWFHNSLSQEHMTKVAHESVKQALSELVQMCCVTWSKDGYTIRSTRSGVLMCRRYIRSKTMQAFLEMDDCGDFDEVIRTLANAHEFQELTLCKQWRIFISNLKRIIGRNQKQWLNDISWNHGIYKGPKRLRVKDVPDKVFQLIQALLVQNTPRDRTLARELVYIHKEAPRILKALLSYATTIKRTAVSPKVFLLLRCMQNKSWFTEELSQLPTIGPSYLQKLYSKDIVDLESFVRAQKALLLHELGENRLRKAKQRAEEILRMRIRVRPAITKERKLLLKLESILPPETAIKGTFEVFVVQEDRLIFHKSKAKAGDVFLLKRGLYKAESLLYCLHSTCHGIDVVNSLPPIPV